jgi:hypothetical protein
LHFQRLHGSPTEHKPNISLAFIATILEHLVDASDLLGSDATLREVWSDILSHLAPLPTGTVNDTAVFLPQEEPFYYKDGQNPMQVYGIFPGERIGMVFVLHQNVWVLLDARIPHACLGLKPACERSDNMPFGCSLSNRWCLNTAGISSPDKLRQIAIDTIAFSDAWNNGNAFCTLFPAAVRACYNATDTINWLEARLGKGAAASYGHYHRWHWHSLLLQHRSIPPRHRDCWQTAGTLRFFPVWPEGEPASFTSLRTVGAFLVSAEITAAVVGNPSVSGLVRNFVVESGAGRPCQLLSPWRGKTVIIQRRSEKQTHADSKT